MATCNHCGGPATHTGHAFPAGGSFPVTGCVPCLEGLAKDMGVDVRHLNQPEGTHGHRANCTVCGWRSVPWPTHDEAGRNATWHVFENHPDHWCALFGDNTPRDADPRKDS